MPNIWMKLTPLVPNASRLTARSTAAIDTSLPVRDRPPVTDSSRLAPCSCISLIRLSTKTS
jgi:hypothetical protein